MLLSVRSIVSTRARAVMTRTRQAEGAQPVRLACELGQVAQHLPGDSVRDQALHEPRLQRPLQLAEHRERP